MLKMRKILSVALVAVMLLSTVAFNSFALTEGKTIGLVLESDKTAAEIVPGAAVTVTLKFEMADFNTLLSDSRICLLYDNTVYTPDINSRVWLNDLANYAKDTTKASINANFAKACMNESTMTAEEKALYNSGVMQQILADAINKGVTSKGGIAITEDGNTGISVAQMQITFKVTGDAAAIAAGNINIAMCNANNATQYIKKTDGSNTPEVFPAGVLDTSRANILANMPVAKTLTVSHYKEQIRFDKVDGNVTFDYRYLAKITADDFNATFGNETDALQKIKEIGFIFTDQELVKPADFSMDTAKALAMSADEVLGNYVKKKVSYLSTMDADMYVFSCIVTGITPEQKTNGANVLAYVKYEGADGADAYAFYDAAVSSTFEGLYEKHIASV